METYHNIGSSTDWIVMVVYFLAIMLFGSYFGKYNRSTQDFFFGGRRFSWWLIAFSIVATGVGSHSFVKYSAKGFEHGFASTMTYMNDWFFIPFFLFGWLPIIVYTKIRSIPEYFEKRFSPSARFLATLLLLFYMVGYIGIGFLTLGKAVLPMLPESFSLFGETYNITLMGAVIVIAIITGIYITFGGQTAVIFTDLLQGFILLFAGFLVFFLGMDYLGGFKVFWDLLPTEWKLPLAHFNHPPDFNFVGIFWQDGVAGSVGFLFMNMGLVMRFMATKSVDEGRKAATFNIIAMLPLSAIVVGGAGWIGKAISVQNPEIVSPNTSPDQIFVVVAIFLGIFWKRFTPAAVMATFVGGVSLMILGLHDPNLITPFAHGIEMNPSHPYSYIRALYNTFVCVAVAVIATFTYPWQKSIVAKIKEKANHKSIINSMITVSVLLFFAVIVGNNGPEILQIISSVVISIFVAISTTYYVKYDEEKNTLGLTAWSVNKAKEFFKGGKINDKEGEKVKVHYKIVDNENDELVHFSENDMKKMAAEEGDLVYISDARKYLGGLKSIHAKFGKPHKEDGIVYLTEEQLKNGVFVEGKLLEAEKEM